MTKSLTFILLSFHTLCCMGGNTITTAKQPTLDDLDKVISASKEYTKKYEQEVGMLKIKYVHAKVRKTSWLLLVICLLNTSLLS